MKLPALLIASLLLAFNLAAQANTNEVTAKVQDPSGKPIAGATVECHAVNGIESTKGPKITTTGADGVAKFAVTQDWSLLVARKQGLSIAAGYFSATASQPTVLIMDKPLSVSGIVVDESDKPVPDVKVAVVTICFGPPIRPSTSYMTSEVFEDILTARTGPDGRFKIEGLATNSGVVLDALKSGKALIRQRQKTPGPIGLMGRAGQEDVKLTMQLGGTLEGRVVIPNGVKASDVRITVSSDRLPVPAHLNPDGSFRFEDAGPGTWRIYTDFGTNHPPEWVAPPAAVSVEAGKVTRDVTITPVKGGILEVAVFSKAGHKPARDTMVYVRGEQGLGEGGTTAEDGLRRFRLVPGLYNVSANNNGTQAQESSVEIEEGKTNRVELESSVPLQIIGMVRDTNGVPVAGIEVRNVLTWGPESVVKTDTNGHFQMKPDMMGGAGRETPFLLVRDRERNLAAARDVDAGTETYDLQLAPGLVLSGRVQNEQGKPLTNAVVRWVAWGGNVGVWIDETNPPAIDAEGRFQIHALPVGRRYSLDATAKGYGFVSSKVETYETNSELEPFVLRVADQKIAGVVVDLEDKPVKEARVHIYGSGQPQTEVQTDEKGEFHIDEVCEGLVNVNASVSGQVYLSGSVRVQAGDTNIILRVGEQGRRVAFSEPRRASLVGTVLPDLTAAGISTNALQTNKLLLICLFDPEQRPSRRALRLLADQNDALKQKGVTVVGVSAALTTTDALKEWKQANPTPFAVGGVTEKNDKTQWILKTEKFPWLILTDAQGRVKAEGFELDELDAKLK